FFSTRANTKGVWVGIVASLLFATYGVLTKEQKSLDLGRFNFPWHPIMIGVVAHVVLAGVGYAASFLFGGIPNTKELTWWGWREQRKKRQQQSLNAQPIESPARADASIE